MCPAESTLLTQAALSLSIGAVKSLTMSLSNLQLQYICALLLISCGTSAAFSSLPFLPSISLMGRSPCLCAVNDREILTDGDGADINSEYKSHDLNVSSHRE